MAPPNPRQYVGLGSKPGGWYSVEDFLNELTVFILASSTVKALAVAPVDSNGNQVTPLSIPSTVTSATKTITAAGTPEKLVAASTPCKYVLVSADIGSGAICAVGGSSTKATNGAQQGAILTPGMDPIRIDIDDVFKLYGDSQTSGGKISFVYFT